MRKVQAILALAVVMLTAGYASASGLGLNYEKFENFSTTATKASGDGAAHKGMVILQPDFNIGAHHGFYGGIGAFGYYGFVPGFTFNVDFGVHDYVSVGPYIGFGGRSGYMDMAVGARAVFHWWQLLDDKVNADLLSDKIDFYFPVNIGIRMDRWKGYYWDKPGKEWRFRANGGAGLGIRYYFVEKFGVNFEWGYQEMSWAKFGLTVKLN